MSAPTPGTDEWHEYWQWHCNRCEAPIVEPRRYRDWYDGPIWECPKCFDGPEIARAVPDTEETRGQPESETRERSET